jgi:GT2 family glycosyltransferase
MIPILGIPIVNGFHWLERLVDSIDFPIDRLMIVNNNSADTDLTNKLDELSAQKHNYINNIHICHLPSNIGVSSSWNLIIKSNLSAPYWLISNHDVSFTPGILEQFYNLANNYSCNIIHGHAGDFSNGSYELFLIKDSLISKIGLFDENFYPAYGEDTDYIMRIHNYNILNPNNQINKVFLDTPFFHGENLTSDPDCYHKSGSQTARQSQEIFNKLQNINIINFEYMNKKWGDEWRMTNPYRFPMNCESIPVTYTSYDLEFCRSKYLDFN